MERLCLQVVYSCASIDRLPMSLDVFLHRHSLLPCTSFIREYPHLHVTWSTIVRTILERTDHKDCHRQQLQMWIQRLDDKQNALPLDGVQSICDPDRTRYLQELLNGTYVNRDHIETLLQREEDLMVADQTTYMKEAILAHFPPGGLETDSAAELVNLFVS